MRNMDKKEIENKIYELIDSYFSAERPAFVPGETKIALQNPPIGSSEVKEALESLLSTWVTMGKKVKSFESSFSEYLGTKNATMVNSGSSANLLALSMLTNPRYSKRLQQGDEVITPAVTWATTVMPIANVGLTPTLVDVDIETFNINTEAIENAITEKTKAIMPVHLLGNPAEMKRILEIAEEKNLHVIEDSCEAHGAEVDGKKVGSMGNLGTFSFFISHHITTMEGGMIVTNNEELDELSRAMRVFGWIRDMKDKENIAKQYSQIDSRFLFHNVGYNFRPTDLQGAFGMHQIKKIEGFIKIRKENAEYWNKILNEYSDYLILQNERPGTRHAWFSHPITVKKDAPFTRTEFMSFLESKKIETRPIQASDITQQPCIELMNHRVPGNLENAKTIHTNSFFLGNHQDIRKEEKEYVGNMFVEFLDGVKK